MVEFMNEWGTVLKTILSIIALIGIIWGFLKKLNKMGENLEIIPSLREDLNATMNEFRTFKSDHEAYEKMIVELKDNLKEHCAKDKQKQKMSLDMARQILLNEMEKAIKEREVTVSRKAVIGELYDSYEAWGGNGAVHDLWAEFVHLPLK